MMMGNTMFLSFLLHYIHIAKIDTWQKTIQMGSAQPMLWWTRWTDRCHNHAIGEVSVRIKKGKNYSRMYFHPLVQCVCDVSKNFGLSSFLLPVHFFFLEGRFNLAVVDCGNLARRWGCWWNQIATLMGQPSRGRSFLFTDLRSGVDSG